MKNKIPAIYKAILLAGLVCYPVLVYLGLSCHLPLRLLGILLAGAVVAHFACHRSKGALAAGGLVVLLVFTFNQALFLKLYPVLMNTTFFLVFFLSLFKEPIIAQFAVRMGYTLDEKGKDYARKATIAWSIFLFMNGMISAVTVFLPLPYWTLYNGLISYVLIGTMFIGEMIIRKKVTACS